MLEQIQNVFCLLQENVTQPKKVSFQIDLAIRYTPETKEYYCYDTDVLDAVKAKARLLPHINSENLDISEVVWGQRLPGLKAKIKYHLVKVIGYPD